jgi:hypothetical protein
MSLLPPHIPPRSVVRLVRGGRKRSIWSSQLGREFRVGYYNPNDGLDCIWLVNDDGEYEQTIDGESLLKNFEIVKISDETDYFGKSRPALGKLRQSARSAQTRRGRSSANAAHPATARGALASR